MAERLARTERRASASSQASLKSMQDVRVRQREQNRKSIDRSQPCSLAHSCALLSLLLFSVSSLVDRPRLKRVRVHALAAKRRAQSFVCPQLQQRVQGRALAASRSIRHVLLGAELEA